jgi:hypothetical protein
VVGLLACVGRDNWLRGLCIDQRVDDLVQVRVRFNQLLLRENRRSGLERGELFDARLRLAEVVAAQLQFRHRLATRDDVVVSLVGLDAFNWKLARFTLSTAPLRAIEGVVGYEIAYLAAPGLARLRELTAHAVPTTPLSSTHA